jgi:ABC-2 type transport system permease protein
MNPYLVGSLVHKDISLFFRNRFFALITALGVVVYIVIYFVMPKSVDDALEIGLYTPVSLPAFEQLQDEGLEFTKVASEEQLKQSVIDGQFIAGLALPADILDSLLMGQKPRIKVFFATDTPPEIKDAIEVVIKELSYQQTGQSLAIEVSEKFLGPDLAGTQLPPRDRLRPLLAVLLIMVETMGIATLISEEVERRTIHALLVTPATVTDVFAAKGITGVILAFGQAALFMAIVGGLNRQPLIVLSALLLGALLVIATGFIIGALAKDMLSVIAWSLPVLIILIIPSIGIVFPGSVTDWVKVLPTYYLVDTVYRASSFGSGWGDIWQNLLILLGFDLVLLWLGIIILRRKTR